VDGKASLTDIPHLGPEGLPCVQLQLNGQIDLVPEVAPVLAFHLWDSHVENRANSAILDRLAHNEVCPHFEGLADGGSTVYEEKKQEVLALGRLGWSLRRIQQATRIRRETASAYLKALGLRCGGGGESQNRPTE